MIEIRPLTFTQVIAHHATASSPQTRETGLKVRAIAEAGWRQVTAHFADARS